jgi:hypothetical protein
LSSQSESLQVKVSGGADDFEHTVIEVGRHDGHKGVVESVGRFFDLTQGSGDVGAMLGAKLRIWCRRADFATAYEAVKDFWGIAKGKTLGRLLLRCGYSGLNILILTNNLRRHLAVHNHCGDDLTGCLPEHPICDHRQRRVNPRRLAVALSEIRAAVSP